LLQPLILFHYSSLCNILRLFLLITIHHRQKTPTLVPYTTLFRSSLQLRTAVVTKRTTKQVLSQGIERGSGAVADTHAPGKGGEAVLVGGLPGTAPVSSASRPEDTLGVHHGDVLPVGLARALLEPVFREDHGDQALHARLLGLAPFAAHTLGYLLVLLLVVADLALLLTWQPVRGVHAEVVRGADDLGAAAGGDEPQSVVGAVLRHLPFDLQFGGVVGDDESAEFLEAVLELGGVPPDGRGGGRGFGLSGRGGGRTASGQEQERAAGRRGCDGTRHRDPLSIVRSE